MTSHRRQRRLGSRALWISLLAAVLGAPQAMARGVLIAEPHGGPALEALAPGYGLWLERRLRAAGVEVERAPSAVDELAELQALASEQGLANVLRPSLVVHRGVAEVRLQLHTQGSEAPTAAARASAPLAKVGGACEQSAVALLGSLGAGAGGNVPKPTLDELATSSRALRWLETGQLHRAWREVDGRLSATPLYLREQILALARRPDSPDAEAARVLAASGDASAAWKRISRQVGAQRSAATPDAGLLLAAAEVQLARGNPRGAHAHLDRLDANDSQVQVARGRAYALQNDHVRAHKALSEAAQLDPENPRPLLMLEELVDPEPRELAQILTKAASREAERLSPRRAERLLRRAVELDRRVARSAWRQRAALAERVGDPARALEAWREVAASEGEDAETWAGIGRAQRALGDEQGIASLEKALELAPRDAGILTELGEMHVEYGRAELAVPLLEQARERAPRRSETRHALARALRETGDEEGALEVLTGPGAPEPDSAETLRAVAALQRETGDVEGAQRSLERAGSLEPWRPDLHADLADAGAPGGSREADARAALPGGDAPAAKVDPAGAEGPDLGPLVRSFASQVAEAKQRRVAHLGLREPDTWVLRVLRWLHPREPDFARLDGALERALAQRFDARVALLPESPILREGVDRLYAFDEQVSLDAHTIAEVNSAAGTDAIFVSRLTRLPKAPEPGEAAGACADPTRYEIELRMLSGQHADLASILVDVECLPDGLGSFSTWNRRAALPYGCVLLLLIFPLLRGWGRLVVQIDLPPRTKGFLRIKIGRNPEKVRGDEKTKRKKRRAGRLRRSLASFSRFRKHMAGRETLFRWIPARHTYYVTVHGPLYDAMGDQEIGHFLEEQRVRIERGKTARLSYDFNPDECAVQVAVLMNGQPVRGARVSVRDQADSLRYVRDGAVFYYLGLGTHTLCAGAGDRATERDIEIKSLENAIPVDIDLGDENGLFVKGAPEAVEPYLIGDFMAAADHLAAAGETQLAHLMRGAHLQRSGQLEAAAAEYEAAGCIEEAAELRASGADHDGSAALFEQAGDFARAAEAYREAGQLDEAGRCFEAAYDYDSAIECFERSGATERVVDLHEKTGAYLQAATLAQEHGDLDRALENLKAIERRDPNFGEACRRIGDILAERGQIDAAAESMARAIEVSGGEAASVDLHRRYAEILRMGSDKTRALEAFETVRRMAPGSEDVTQHISQLRQELSVAAGAPAAAGRPAGESRYEILGELGRGGMGVVWKARDKRLGRIVALKQLPDNLRENHTAAKLFLREARAAAALNHPNIVTVYDADEENGVFHITMELLEGANLAAIQQKRGAIAPKDVARLAIQVCAGLQYAHDARVVHRDIKTGNLFFTKDRIVKIMDFGLAKTIEEVRKNSTVIGGTPYYMAPEQAVGDAVDARTDLYALGVTLYRLLTGHFPFTEGDLTYHHRNTPAPDPRERVPAIPEGMARLILDLLAKDPSQRPASAGEVGERLRRLFAPPA